MIEKSLEEMTAARTDDDIPVIGATRGGVNGKLLPDDDVDDNDEMISSATT